MVAAMVALAFVCTVVVAPFAPRLAGIGLALAAIRTLRMYPRKTIDIAWLDLLAALRFVLLPTGKSRAELEAAICRRTSDRGDALVCLSVRTGVDLLLTKLDLPKGSEVLLVPGITIPSMVSIIKEHGLRPVGVDPPSSTQLLVPELKPYITEETRVLIVTHLFGAVFDVAPLINEAKQHGLFVIEDCAQAFLGATTVRQADDKWSRGFCGHDEVDASFVSFGTMKTLTALGGAVCRIRDARLRQGMQELQASYPVRSDSQFFQVTLKACGIKLLGNPYLWGLAAAVVYALGYDFDELIVHSVRGFPNNASIRKRPSLPLLHLLARRMRDQSRASFSNAGASASSSVAQRRAVGALIADHLTDGGATVVSSKAETSSWWLLPVLDEDPKGLVQGLWSRGFDATCSSTQLKGVPVCAKGAPNKSSQISALKLMNSIVYLPVTPELSQHAAKALAEAVIEVQRRRSVSSPTHASLFTKLETVPTRMRTVICMLVLALALTTRPAAFLHWLPSSQTVLAMLVTGAALATLLVLGARTLAAEPELHVGRELLHALIRKTRTEGVAYWHTRPPLDGRIDGAVLLTGSTGFVGGGILFALLARSREMKISRIILLIRIKIGTSVEARLAELRANPAFDEVREDFDRLVVALEGDTAQIDFGWKDGQRMWQYNEPLRVVLHCAGNVRFDQSLQQAAVSLISGSLQVAQLAARWQAQRFVFVSTAFVHAVPSATNFLAERLVELRDFDPMELYRDAVSHGHWAEKAMHELGFPNTYTFAKAIAEHLVLRACTGESLDVRIVRPCIVGPAWAAPYAGWCGDKASTIVAAAALLAGRGIRVFRCSAHPCPIVPVDFVADAAIKAMVGLGGASGGRIVHATIDASEADRIPSFRTITECLLRVLALRGDISLPEAGLLFRFHRWADSPNLFWLLHSAVNVTPNRLVDLLTTAVYCAANMVGLCTEALKNHCKVNRWLSRNSSLPAQYLPFSSPLSPWLFHSSQRLPTDWNAIEYILLIHEAAIAFARGKAHSISSRSSSKSLHELRVVSQQSVWYDAFFVFSMPGSPLCLSAAAFFVRRVLHWMDLTVTIDVTSLVSVTDLGAPLVLCPTHRSLLDFVIIGLTCFQLRPIIPVLQVPHVAADAEFSGLPILGRLLVALGAFFVRRGGGAVQPDPALRAEVGRVFRNGRPMEVFLEGLRSRGRRHMRLRTGLLRALRDVSQRTVALVPLSLSYELLPEDQSFYDELEGRPRPPLSTLSLVQWVLRGLRGELPCHGDAHVRLGPAKVLDASANLQEVLSEVQEQLVGLTSLTTLHARALAELLELPVLAVCDAFLEARLPLRKSRIGNGVFLTHAQRWPLALQAAVLLREKLPKHWAQWIVEPVVEKRRSGFGDVGLAARPSPSVAEMDGHMMHIKSEKTSVLNIDAVSDALCRQLEAAMSAGQDAAQALKDSGITEITEEHLVQQLLQGQDNRQLLPPPLARGAGAIIARRLGPHTSQGSGNIPARSKELSVVMPLWPTAYKTAQHLNNEEALDRWGFKDTRFFAQWIDGQPAVQIASKRYGAIGERPSFKLWSFFQSELKVSMNVRDTLPERPLPVLSPPAQGLSEHLATVLPKERVRCDAEARLRAGTGHGLEDIWRLRTRETLRMPDAVVRPETEEEVLAVLKAANGAVKFAVVPVGGRTNVTSATACPAYDVDPRPFVALDMRGLAKVLWVNEEDGAAHVQAGITGSVLKEALRQQGVTMGMEPDSMELSTLGGWIATRASGMKRARYGNIEDMVLEVRVATPGGILWQRHGGSVSNPTAVHSAFGRTSTNVELTGLMLGSEGCLGIVTSAIVRIRRLPEAVEYQSVVFPDWDHGAKFMREVARLPAALRPASCRLMDNKQLQLSQAIREDGSHSQLRGALKAAYLRVCGVGLGNASAVTLLFEGSHLEVSLQKRTLGTLVRQAKGIWGGKASGEAGYALTFAIAYIRDFGLDYRIMSESLETLAPWSTVKTVWPAVIAAVKAEHRALRVPGQPFLSVRMTQLYDEGAVLYMYLAISTAGLSNDRALEVFQSLEHTARRTILDAGGCLSHHHGIGKLRAALLPDSQAPMLSAAMQGLKVALDPGNVLGARNGAWSSATVEPHLADNATEAIGATE